MSANLFLPASAKNLRTAGIGGILPAVQRRLFSCKHFSHLAKPSLADICSKHPLFPFAQNRGKFAPNCLALQLLHLLYKVAHKGKQGAKKGEPFWLAYSCVFLFYISYLIKSLLTDICSKHLLFTFAQNRGKFALNCFSLQLLHLLRKAAHKGKQDAKKRRTF